jgi:membrane protease YdiL (CAAX protease family)
LSPNTELPNQPKRGPSDPDLTKGGLPKKGDGDEEAHADKGTTEEYWLSALRKAAQPVSQPTGEPPKESKEGVQTPPPGKQSKPKEARAVEYWMRPKTSPVTSSPSSKPPTETGDLRSGATTLLPEPITKPEPEPPDDDMALERTLLGRSDDEEEREGTSERRKKTLRKPTTFGDMLPAFWYIAGIAVAELVTGMLSTTVGITLHAVIILALMVHAAIASPDPKSKFYVSLSLVPLMRVISLSMPLKGFTVITWYLVIAVPLLLGAFMAIKTFKYKPSDIYFTSRNWGIQIILPATGIAFGIALYYALYRTTEPPRLINSLNLQEALVPAIILLLATGFTLELIFRGLLQRSSIDSYGNWGWIPVALAFAAIHIAGLNAAEIGIAFLMGLYFCWVVKQTGSIWGVMLAHGVANIALLLVAPFYL